MLTDAELSDLKSRPENDCGALAQRFGVTLHRSGSRTVGPCPLCCTDLSSRRKACFEIKENGYAFVCAKCHQGGDCIELVSRYLNIEFLAAVEWLGGTKAVDPAIAAARERERKAQQDKRDRAAAYFRERARTNLYTTWNKAHKLPGTPAEAYLKLRGIDVPPHEYEKLRLRYMDNCPFFHGEEIGPDGKKYQRIIHRGPAMLAPITDNEGKFRGLQFTWIDLAQPKGKAAIIDPDTGEEASTKGRKTRGSVAGNHIDLVGPRAPKQIIVGEGTESTLSIWQTMIACGIDISTTAFWSALDLGNLGGPAQDSLTYRTEDNKPRRCPGLTPALDKPQIILPDSTESVVMVGDGDSHPLLTQAAIYRGVQRWRIARPDVLVRVAWADKGTDFNDMLRGS
jgi:hypothetical protein